jgi:quercetin dioxygenase-like cupin family protein
MDPVNIPGAAGVTMAVAIGAEEGAPTFTMRMFNVAPGGHTPSHAHAWEHEVYIQGGAGTFRGETGDVPLKAGDTVFVPGGETHQFVAATDAPLQFICLVPNNGQQAYKPQNGDMC